MGTVPISHIQRAHAAVGAPADAQEIGTVPISKIPFRSP